MQFAFLDNAWWYLDVFLFELVDGPQMIIQFLSDFVGKDYLRSSHFSYKFIEIAVINQNLVINKSKC